MEGAAGSCPRGEGRTFSARGAWGLSPGVPDGLRGAALPLRTTVAGSGRLGSSAHAGRSEGGGWQGLQPGMCPGMWLQGPPQGGGWGHRPPPGRTQWPRAPCGVGRWGLPCSLPCSCPLLPQAPARGGSPRAMRSSLSVAAQSPGQGIRGGGSSGVGTTSVENVKVQLRRRGGGAAPATVPRQTPGPGEGHVVRC